MRIRFVTRAHLQVPQASKTEKHTIPDGPIPLYGLSPSAVSRQWGVGETNEYGTVWAVFPISFINTPVVVATHNGLDAVVAYVSSSERNANQVAIVLHKIIDNSVGSAWGVSWIAIGI